MLTVGRKELTSLAVPPGPALHARPGFKSALYIAVQQAAPDFAGGYRPGADLYSGSVVVLDTKTGSLAHWYQLVPHDVHDWDIAAAPVLLTTKLGARRCIGPQAKTDSCTPSISLPAKVVWKTPKNTIDNIEPPLTVAGTHFVRAPQKAWSGTAPRTPLSPEAHLCEQCGLVLNH